MSESKNKERSPQGVALELCGQMLYGDVWQSAMANDLKINSTRRIRQFLAGDIDVPVGIWEELEGKLKLKQHVISETLVAVQAVRLEKKSREV